MTQQHATFKSLNRAIGRAIHRYDMISDGDRILVALSGGKDSLSLLWMLLERRTRVPIRYDLVAVHIDPGFENGFAASLRTYCQTLEMPVRIEYTDCGVVSHGSSNRENPCFLCSRLRRKRLFELAVELGCNKIAFGHNKDDIIETLFINMCYAGEISTMRPSQSFFRNRLTVIRPLAFADEQLIRRFGKLQRFPDFINPCPTAQTSKRREIKELLNRLYRSNSKIKGNLFRALSHVRTDYLLT